MLRSGGQSRGDTVRLAGGTGRGSRRRWAVVSVFRSDSRGGIRRSTHAAGCSTAVKPRQCHTVIVVIVTLPPQLYPCVASENSSILRPSASRISLQPHHKHKTNKR